MVEQAEDVRSLAESLSPSGCHIASLPTMGLNRYPLSVEVGYFDRSRTLYMLLSNGAGASLTVCSFVAASDMVFIFLLVVALLLGLLIDCYRCIGLH